MNFHERITKIHYGIFSKHKNTENVFGFSTENQINHEAYKTTFLVLLWDLESSHIIGVVGGMSVKVGYYDPIH